MFLVVYANGVPKAPIGLDADEIISFYQHCSLLGTSTMLLGLHAPRQLIYGLLLGLSLSLTSTSLAYLYQTRRRKRLEAQAPLEFDPRPIELRSDEIINGVTGLIGNTPLVRIESLSQRLGVEILGKAEVC